MQGLHVGLFHRLDRHTSHGGPAHRFADRFRIATIILVGLLGLDILGTHHLTRSDLLKRSTPVMRTAARLHPVPGRQIRHRVDNSALDASARHGSPSRIHPVQLEHIFRHIDSQSRSVQQIPSLPPADELGCARSQLHVASREAPVGRRLGPFH